MREKLLRGYCLVTAKQWAVRARAQHHIGFRYYRLAQSTEDLYDGFRNMYLAFEVLLSSKYPKARDEQEIEWLERGLREATESLSLGDVVPTDEPDPVAAILQRVSLRYLSILGGSRLQSAG